MAYYYEKFEGATFRFLHSLKVEPVLGQNDSGPYSHKTELHNRDIYYIKSALISAGENPVIGHKLYKADSDILCTTMQQTLSIFQLRHKLSNGMATARKNACQETRHLGFIL